MRDPRGMIKSMNSRSSDFKQTLKNVSQLCNTIQVYLRIYFMFLRFSTVNQLINGFRTTLLVSELFSRMDFLINIPYWFKTFTGINKYFRYYYVLIYFFKDLYIAHILKYSYLPFLEIFTEKFKCSNIFLSILYHFKIHIHS